MKYFSKFLSLFLVGAMLYATGCTDYDQDIKDLNNKVDELEQTLQGQIDPLKADLEAVQTALKAAIADGEALKAQHEEDVKALQDADAKAQKAIEEALKAMEAGDAELDKKIADAVAAIEAANGEIAKLQTVDAEIKENLKTLEDSLKTTQGDVESLKEIAMQLVAWSANVDGTLAAMNTEIEGINESLESLEGDVDSLKLMIQQHEEWITNAEGRLGNLEEYKAYADEQFELLAKADKDLNDLVANLQTDLADYQKIVNEQLTKAFAEIGENTAKINALTADLEAKYNALVAADEAMQAAIAQHEEWITNAETRIADLQEDMEEVQSNLEALQADYDAFKEDVATRLRNAEGSIGQLQVDVQGLNDKLNEFKAAYDEHIAAYEEFVKKTNEAITDMQAIIDAIIGRVQSIAFVPEYVDGKATINWATFGDRILEGRSVLVYQVYPAECAAAIANAPAVGDVVSPLSFDMTDALKTRGGLDKAPQMNIVGVEGDEDGRLYVTVEARNFGEKFYAGEVEYAASLVLTTENENLASCYTNLVALSANKVEAIEMRIMATKDVTATAVKEGAEFVDVTGNTEVYTYELEYANIEANPDFISLPGYYLEFSYNGEWYNKFDLRAQCGLEIGDIKMERQIDLLPGQAVQYTTVINETTGYSEECVDITKADANAVGKEFNKRYVYMYPGTDKKITAGSTLKIVAEQRTVNVGEFTETWTYSLDAKGDAGMGIYYRNFTTTEKVFDGKELPEGVTLADVINGDKEPDIVVTDKDGKVVEDVITKITAKGDEVAIYFANFIWNENYSVVAKYGVLNESGIASMEVNVKFTVNTVNRSEQPILVNLDPTNYDFVSNLVLTNQISDSIGEQIFAALTFNHSNIDVEKDVWFQENMIADKYTSTCDLFVDDATEDEAINVDYNNPEWGTMLFINEVDAAGQAVYTTYNYSDFDFIPEQITYTKTIKTWYGQEIIINKVLNFVFPTIDAVDFKEAQNYVKFVDGVYQSKVHPAYSPSADSNAITSFSTKEVNMNAAFNLTVDGKLVLLGLEDGLASSDKYDFVAEFKLENGVDKDGNPVLVDEFEGVTIANNSVNYDAKPEYVDVFGQLYVTNDNGAKHRLATSFDGEGKYSTYKVVKYDPITEPSDVQKAIPVTSAIEYTYNLFELIDLRDYRDGYTTYSLIDPKTGAFVIGDGTNGFANGTIVKNIYSLEHYWSAEFTSEDKDLTVEEIKKYVKLDSSTGILKFDNTHELNLVKPIKVKATLVITTPWSDHDVNVFVEFYQATGNVDVQE